MFLLLFFFIFCWRIIMDFKGFKCSSWNLKYIRALDLYSHECTWKKLGCGTVSGTPVTGCIHQSNHLFILSFALGEILLQRLHFPWVHRRVRLGWVSRFLTRICDGDYFGGVAMNGSATQEWWIWRTQISFHICKTLRMNESWSGLSWYVFTTCRFLWEMLLLLLKM